MPKKKKKSGRRTRHFPARDIPIAYIHVSPTASNSSSPSYDLILRGKVPFESGTVVAARYSKGHLLILPEREFEPGDVRLKIRRRPNDKLLFSIPFSKVVKQHRLLIFTHSMPFSTPFGEEIDILMDPNPPVNREPMQGRICLKKDGINVKCEQRLKDALVEIARARDIPLSALVRDILEIWLEEREDLGI